MKHEEGGREHVPQFHVSSKTSTDNAGTPNKSMSYYTKSVPSPRGALVGLSPKQSSKPQIEISNTINQFQVPLYKLKIHQQKAFWRRFCSQYLQRGGIVGVARGPIRSNRVNREANIT